MDLGYACLRPAAVLLPCRVALFFFGWGGNHSCGWKKLNFGWYLVESS